MSERKQTPDENDLAEDEITRQEAEELRDHEGKSVASSTPDDMPVLLPGGMPVDLGPPPPSTE